MRKEPSTVVIGGIIDKVYSKIVGVQAVPQRQKYIKVMKDLNLKKIDLVPDPENSFDPDALMVMATLPQGRVQVGFIKNSERWCEDCNAFVAKQDDEKCPKCGTSVVRKGLASKIREFQRQGIKYEAQITAYTGGDNEKTMGVNIQITRVL